LLAIAGAVLLVSCSDDAKQTAPGALDEPAKPPTVLTPEASANFTAEVTAGVDTLNVQFKDTSTTKGTGWTWAFGDDATHISQNPKHQYSWPTEGQDADLQVVTFDVTLRVEGPGGPATKTKTDYITLYRPVHVDSVVASTEPVPAGSVVAFASTVSGPPVEAYHWDFGDGEKGTGEKASHTYAKPGTYVATVTVAGTMQSNTATGTTEVIVYEPAAVPTLLGLSVRDARTVLTVAGLEWSVTHPAKSAQLASAQQALAATPKTKGVPGRYLNQGLSNVYIPPGTIANPAWAPVNATYVRLKSAYDLELKSGIWTVEKIQLDDGSPISNSTFVAKGSIISLICK
jgi:PKD repeat protein